MEKHFSRRHRRETAPKIRTVKKGIYILPSLLTSLSLLCGFYSIVATLNGDFLKAAWAILFSAVFDGLDGRVARITNSTTKFGLEYDSLSDLVAFGVAPAVLVYGWALKPFGRLGWLAAFLFVACGAVRLARFNIQVNNIESKYFHGLPIPVAAGMIATAIILFAHFGIGQERGRIPVLLIVYFLAVLMVSTVKYNSFKDLQLWRRKPINRLIMLILLIFVVILEPQIVLFSICFAYVFSGPTAYIYYLTKRKENKHQKTSENTIERAESSNEC